VNADLSVAPEIAQLAMPLMNLPPPPGSAPRHDATTGQLATALSRLAVAPQRWWDLVRFNPDGPARIAVPAPFEAWLLVIPPGHAAACPCHLATLVAGEASEGSAPPGPAARAGLGQAMAGRAALRPGRVRVHAPGTAGHAVISAGHGYSVSLHASALPAPQPCRRLKPCRRLSLAAYREITIAADAAAGAPGQTEAHD
jgi:hypothetical protein